MSSLEMTALIVSEPGPLQDGLWDLMSTLPNVKLLGTTGNLNEVISILTSVHPALILIDTHNTSCAGIQQLLVEIKASHPGVICIVVAGDVEQKEIALAAGADSAQITGYPAEELYHTIQRQLDLHTGGC
jgi:response regulator of citrate/malate metabolism